MKIKEATVLRNSLHKTTKVVCVNKLKHPKYGKYINYKTTLLIHDEESSLRKGDFIRIAESRPISAKKHWKLYEVIRRSIL